MSERLKFLALCSKSLSGELSADERIELESWLVQSKANRKVFEEMGEAWRMVEPQSIPNIPDVRNEWRILERSLGIAPEKAQADSSKFLDILSRVFNFGGPRSRAIAVSLVSLVLVATAAEIWRNHHLQTTFTVFQTANGEQARIVLPDGSTIRLNSGSRLEHPRRFSGDVRRVSLSGEAFFEVAHDGKSFEVVTENAKTTVLGTRFNVRARDGQTRVVVEDGRVRFASLHSPDGVVLAKGEMSLIGGKGAPSAVASVNSDRLLGWLSGKMVFEKTPLSEIVGELERKFDVSIELADSALTRKTVTAEYDNPSIETVLASLCTALNAKYRVSSGQYIIQYDSIIR